MSHENSTNPQTAIRDRAEALFRKLGYAPNSGFGEKAIPLIAAALVFERVDALKELELLERGKL